MSTKFTYALALTLAGAVFNLILYFTGFQTERLAVGQHLQWLGVVIMCVVLWLGISEVREENPGQGLTYGQGVGAGVLISLYSGLMSAVYVYVHFAYINTAFADYQMPVLREGWAAAGLTDSKMEAAEEMTRKFMTPGMQAAFTPFIVVLSGLLVSLVLAAILKRPPSGEEKVQPPAV